MLFSMLLLELSSCFKMHQARSCIDLHLTASFAALFCITGCDYCRKSRTLSPGTHSLQSSGSLCSPLLQKRVSPVTITKHGKLAYCHKANLPKACPGMEDACAKAGLREGSCAGDPLPALNTNTETKRKTNCKRRSQSGEG